MKGCFHITLVIACAHAASLQTSLGGSDPIEAPDETGDDSKDSEGIKLPDTSVKSGTSLETRCEDDASGPCHAKIPFQDALETTIVNLATSEDEMDQIPTMEEMTPQNAQTIAKIKDMLEKLKAGKVISDEPETDKRPSVEEMKQTNDQREARIRDMLKKFKGGKVQIIKMPTESQTHQKPTREDISERNDQIKAKFREMIKRMKAGKGKQLRAQKKEKNEFFMPVKRQIPLAEMDEFVKKLSPGCGKSFTDMQAGKGGLHAFGSPGGVPANAQGCEKLGGKMCFTDASITKSGNGGAMMRKMMSTTSSSGNSCLPSPCVSTADLRNVASFMKGQVLTIIPGNAHQIKLHVDCTSSGGDSVTVGSDDNSGSAVSAPTTMVLAAVLVVSQYAFMGW